MKEKKQRKAKGKGRAGGRRSGRSAAEGAVCPRSAGCTGRSLSLLINHCAVIPN